MKRYDAAARKRAQRRGRERGWHIYIPAEELEKAGFPTSGPAPYYRVWGLERDRFLIRLYREA